MNLTVMFYFILTRHSQAHTNDIVNEPVASRDSWESEEQP